MTPVQTKTQTLNSQKPDHIVVRHCKAIAEYEQCVTLEKLVWGYSDFDVIPLRVFVVASKIGGQVIGSFEGERLVGFAVSIPGVRSGHAYLHSHMLAVHPDRRNLGLGRRMKLAQREEALRRGIDLIEWTFDPLEIKNAYLNLERLGAIVRRYAVNHYGYSSSPLQGGLPTDRAIAEWWLRSDRVKRKIDENRTEEFTPELKIQVPAEIYAWKTSPSSKDKEKAKEIQLGNRNQFLEAFEAGLAALGYERDAQGNGAFLLGRWRESWSYDPDQAQ